MSSGMNGTKSRGVFSSVAEMQAADLRVGTTVWVYGGSRYDICATDQGSSVQLNNGLWADANSVTVDTSSLVPAIEKGVPNGVATLQGDGKVPASQLPSYVDDVLEYPTFSDFPVTGETGKIYVTIDSNAQYRWTGAIYVEFGSGSTTWGSITGTLANQTDLQNALNEKQEALISGSNVKTVGGQSILGSGDIPLGGAGGLDLKSATFTQRAALPSGAAGVIPFNDAKKFTFSSETLDISTNSSGIVLEPGNYYIKCVSNVNRGSVNVISGALRIKSVAGDSIDVLLDNCITISELRYNLSGSDMIK